MSSSEDWTSIFLEGSMEVPPKSLNASLEGLDISFVELCVIVFEELRFLKLIRLLPEELSVSSDEIISNDTCLIGAPHVKPRRLDFNLD